MSISDCGFRIAHLQFAPAALNPKSEI